MGNPKRYSKEFQERAVRRMKLGENVSQLALDLGLHRTCLYAWKRKLNQDAVRLGH
jgi:transposase-like protein